MLGIILCPITPDILELQFKNSIVVKYICMEHSSYVTRQVKKLGPSMIMLHIFTDGVRQVMKRIILHAQACEWFHL